MWWAQGLCSVGPCLDVKLLLNNGLMVERKINDITIRLYSDWGKGNYTLVEAGCVEGHNCFKLPIFLKGPIYLKPSFNISF